MSLTNQTVLILNRTISEATGRPFVLENRQRLGGGCINSAYRLQGSGQCFFAKFNKASQVQMFQAEAAGLAELAATNTVTVPRPVCWGSSDEQSFLILEYLPLGRLDRPGMATLGKQLARLHRTAGPSFGWSMDNAIGSTPQINALTSDWVQFWRHQRLGFQLELAGRQGYDGSLQRKGERLMVEFPAFLRGYAPLPSLLHGDLWSGNVAGDATGRPVIYDPAVYWGDREADLAMTVLFGGFSPDFYAAYQETYPLDKGYPDRRGLYNLYHILNHLNLFGGSYLSQAQNMLDALLAELG